MLTKKLLRLNQIFTLSQIWLKLENKRNGINVAKLTRVSLYVGYLRAML